MKDLLAGIFMIVALFVLVVALLGCAPTMSPQERAETEFKGLTAPLLVGYDLQRVVDKEAGVVCYVHIRGGVSCLPLSETRLGE